MTGGDRPTTSITLHSSWQGIIGGLIGAVAVLGIGALAIARVGWRPLPTVIVIAGAVFVWTVVFDLPVSSTFDERGIVRHSLGRRHRVPYERIRQLTRSRPKMLGAVRHGGLVAAVGRRRYLLVDQTESRGEFDHLTTLLERVAPELVDVGLTPPEKANPTWLYRRRRWGSDETGH